MKIPALSMMAVFALLCSFCQAQSLDAVQRSPYALPAASEQGIAAENNSSVLYRSNDGVFDCVQESSGLIAVRYVWPNPAVIYQVALRKGQDVYPGRVLFELKINSTYKQDSRGVPIPSRSKPEVKSGISARVIELGEQFSPGQTIVQGTVLFKMLPQVIAHDSVSPGDEQSFHFIPMLKGLWRSTGISDFITMTRLEWTLGIGRLIMILVGLLLVYLAIFKDFEPLLLLPIGFGAVMSNIPLAHIAGPDGILGMLYVGVNLGIYPLLIFLGVGALTDFGPLIANPKTALLGAAAQLGIFGALIGAVLISSLTPDSFIHFSLKDAASIGIIGGADGPTAIFLASRLSPNLLGSIAVAAYSYMALVPIIFPPIIRALVPVSERNIRMSQLRRVSKLEKVLFPISITLLCCLLLPDAAPLISMLMLGNLMREAMCVDRLSDTAQNALMNTVTIFLGLSVGSKLSADKFLNFETLGILVLGLAAFSIGTAGGLLLGRLMSRLSGGKINPMIGAAGVSAVPMAARVVNKVGLETDPQNFLLMHAMGPNVSGVIGSAVAAGILLQALAG
ncbi:MAG: sodium ion-translocating decarboxylase subunit beta [Lentisphaeria bacterium]|nr:sodium ion-translocating decarboxylase subunit beta [Lentisphaeria bacterium]